MNAYARENAVFTALAGLVMLAYAFLGGNVAGVADRGALYDTSFVVFALTLKVGGLAMLACAAFQFTGHRLSILLDGIVTGLCGLALLLCGVTWIAMEKSLLDLLNIMVPIMGIVLMRSGAVSLAEYRRSATMENVQTGQAPSAPRRFAPAAPPSPAQPAAPHPASLASSALPGEGEAPPEGGYLAALSKEKDEPPSASYE